MARSPRVRSTGRSGFRDRHGRGLRSSAAGPHLPFLRTRTDLFDDIVAATAQYLRDMWPDDLGDVVFEVAGLPRDAPVDTLERYRVDPVRRRILLYRLPIERLAHLHDNDEWHHRVAIEGYVFRAVAELLGKDPWDLAPERYRDR